MRRDVRDLFPVDPHLPAVAERLEVVLASSQHFSFLSFHWFEGPAYSGDGQHRGAPNHDDVALPCQDRQDVTSSWFSSRLGTGA
jgi:hypothetical protein